MEKEQLPHQLQEENIRDDNNGISVIVEDFQSLYKYFEDIVKM